MNAKKFANPTLLRDAGMFITGPVGVGKTHFACAVLFEWLASGHRGIFRPWSALYSALRDCYVTRTSERALLEEYVDAEFLVLDDLGAASFSDFEVRMTLHILDSRLVQLRPTVVTSHWTLEQIAEKMDARIASRLAGFQRIEMSGADRRLEGRDEN